MSAAIVLTGLSLKPVETTSRSQEQPSPGSQTSTATTITAPALLQRALEAVSPGDAVMHVVAKTEVRDVLMKQRTAPPSRAARGSRYAHGSPALMRPLHRRSEGEIWIDEARHRIEIDRRHFEDAVPILRYQALEESGTATRIHTDFGPGPRQNWTNGTIKPLEDEPPQGSAEPLRSEDPRDYRRLLEQTLSLLKRSTEGTPTTTRPGTKVRVVGSAVVGGSSVFLVSVRNTSANRQGDTSETSATISIREQDYMPARVEAAAWTVKRGRKSHVFEQRWNVTYSVAETMPLSKVPASAFSLDVPKNTRWHINRAIQPKDASLKDAPAWWLGERFEELRWTGVLRDVSNASEYESMRDPSCAVVLADQSRPVSVGRIVVAEYTLDGKPGNMAAVDARDLKVISMPRLSQARWQEWFERSRQFSFGEVFDLRWTKVDGKPAIALHREAARIDTSPSDHHRLWFDYLMFDTKDGTVLMQGAMLPTGQLGRAAQALVSAK